MVSPIQAVRHSERELSRTVGTVPHTVDTSTLAAAARRFEAVMSVLSSELELDEAARDYDVSATCLATWIERAKLGAQLARRPVPLEAVVVDWRDNECAGSEGWGSVPGIHVRSYCARSDQGDTASAVPAVNDALAAKRSATRVLQVAYAIAAGLLGIVVVATWTILSLNIFNRVEVAAAVTAIVSYLSVSGLPGLRKWFTRAEWPKVMDSRLQRFVGLRLWVRYLRTRIEHEGAPDIVLPVGNEGLLVARALNRHYGTLIMSRRRDPYESLLRAIRSGGACNARKDIATRPASVVSLIKDMRANASTRSAVSFDAAGVSSAMLAALWPRPARVAALVHNSVAHDTRVIKEARSLEENGAAVTVFGLADARQPNSFELSPGGVSVILANARERIKNVREAGANLVRGGVRTATTATAVAVAVLWLFASPVLFSNAAVTVLVTALITVASTLVLSRRSAQTGIRRTLDKIVKKLRSVQLPPVARRRLSYKIMSNTLYEQVVKHGIPDIVHCHDIIALSAGARLKKEFGVDLVWDAHEIYEQIVYDHPGYGRLCHSIIHRNHRLIDAFITINDSIAAFYAERYPALPKATIVMNAARRLSAERYDGQLHRAAGLPLSQKILLFQGGFGAHRGLTQLVEASALLDANWSVVMMGWGALEDDLRDQAKKATEKLPPARAETAIRFIPPVPQAELLMWTAGASLGAICYENVGPNHLYCTPNKLWEYPSAGVPILCSDLVEMAKIVRTHNIGFVLPREFNASDIASAVNRLSTSELNAAQAACDVFFETENWDKYATRVVETFSRLNNLS